VSRAELRRLPYQRRWRRHLRIRDAIEPRTGFVAPASTAPSALHMSVSLPIRPNGASFACGSNAATFQCARSIHALATVQREEEIPMIRYRSVLSAAAVIAAAAAGPSASAGIIEFDLMGNGGSGMLTTNENPPATGTGSGGEVGAGIFYDDLINQLTINVGWGSGAGFSDLTGNVTVAHIHAAPDALFTSNGPVIINLDGATPGFNNSATNGGWTNTQVTLSDAQEKQLLNGFLYLNAHTAANPPGEIRGNLVVIPAPASLGLLALAGVMGGRRRRH
jgi:hypothetical protein